MAGGRKEGRKGGKGGSGHGVEQGYLATWWPSMAVISISARKGKSQ